MLRRKLYGRPALGIATVAATVALAPQAYAFDFSVSGQVNRAFGVADNGDQTDYTSVDNDGSKSRFRFTGSQALDNGLKVGFEYEIGLINGKSNDYDINSNNNDTYINDRLVDIYVKGDFGRLTFGKGDTASQHTSEVDLSGTGYLGGGEEQYYLSGITFLANNNARTGIDIGGGAYNDFDGASRANMVRYDTPSFGGFVASASLINGHAWDTALRYSSSFGNGGKFEAAVDYYDTQQRNENIDNAGIRVSPGNRYQEYGGSASLLLPSGLNFTAMYKYHHFVDGSSVGVGHQQVYFGGVGYKFDKNSFQVGLGHGDRLAGPSSDGNSYQAAYVYHYRKGIQLYASYHYITLDDTPDFKDSDNNTVKGNDLQDIQYALVGVRVKFF